MSLIPEKFRQFGTLPLLTAMRLFKRLDVAEEAPPHVHGRHLSRAHEKVRRQIRKASQRRNR